MTNEEYITNVLKTESSDLNKVRERLTDKNIRLLHATMGAATEAGELVDQMKKHIFYGKELDTVNLEEEIGDLLWYQAVMVHLLGTSFEKLMEKNIAKLRARYGEKFTEDRAINRDLDKERDILDQNV